MPKLKIFSKTINQFLILLSKKEIMNGSVLLFLIFIMAIVDMLGIASIMPFMTVLIDPDAVESSKLLTYLFNFSKKFGLIDNSQFIFLFGVLIFLILILSLVFKAITYYFLLRFSSLLEYSIGKRFIETYLHQPYSWFLNRHSADLGKNILSEIATLIVHGVIPFLNVIAHGTLIITIIFLLIYIDPKLSLIVSVFLGSIYFIIYKIIHKYLKKIGQERMYANQNRFETVTESFDAFKEVKVRGLESIYIKKFEHSSKIYAYHNSTAQILALLPRFLLEGVAFGGMLLVVLYLIRDLENIKLAIPFISLYAFAGYRLLPSLQHLYSSITLLRFVGPALANLYNDIISLQTINYYQKNEKFQLMKNIFLDNVSYKYPSSENFSLNGINIKIPANSTVGIVGLTGSGKTTLIDLLLGLLPASNGQVKVDDIILKKENYKSWVEILGYVPQEIYLADKSIYENVAFGVEKNKIDKKLVHNVCTVANIHQFVIDELKDGYQTKIGEKGVRLSGGQRQRIAIARALYFKPRVLILDEATSSLDNITENKVMESINDFSKEITLIIIAHRLRTIEKCDKIFMLDKGKLIAQGTYEHLRNNNRDFQDVLRGMSKK